MAGAQAPEGEPGMTTEKPKIFKYIKCDSINELNREINYCLDVGYSLYGQLQIVTASYSLVYVQGMAMYPEPPKPVGVIDA
jgi:hypothetical protein